MGELIPFPGYELDVKDDGSIEARPDRFFATAPPESAQSDDEDVQDELP